MFFVGVCFRFDLLWKMGDGFLRCFVWISSFTGAFHVLHMAEGAIGDLNLLSQLDALEDEEWLGGVKRGTLDLNSPFGLKGIYH